MYLFLDQYIATDKTANTGLQYWQHWIEACRAWKNMPEPEKAWWYDEKQAKQKK